LRRELKEELDVEVEVGRLFDAVFYSIRNFQSFFGLSLSVEKGSLKPIECHDLRWVTLKELEALPCRPPTDPIRKHLSSVERDVLEKEASWSRMDLG